MASVLEERAPLHFKDEIKLLMKLLTPPGAPKRRRPTVTLKGSAGLSSQRYPSDFDFFCEIDPDSGPDQFIAFLKTLLAAIDKHPD